MLIEEIFSVLIEGAGMKTLKQIAGKLNIIPEGNKTKKDTYRNPISVSVDRFFNSEYKPPSWAEDLISNNGEGEAQEEVVVDYKAEFNSAAGASEEPETPSQKWERLCKENEAKVDQEKAKLFKDWAEVLDVERGSEYWKYFKIFFNYKHKSGNLDVEEWEAWVTANVMNENLLNEIHTQAKFNNWEAAYKKCREFERKQQEKERKEAEKRATKEAREKEKKSKGFQDKDYVPVGHADRRAWLVYCRYIPVEKRTIRDWELFKNYLKYVISSYPLGESAVDLFQATRTPWEQYFKKVIEIGKAEFNLKEWNEWGVFWQENKRRLETVEELWKEWRAAYWETDNEKEYSYSETNSSSYRNTYRTFVTPEELAAFRLLNLGTNCTKEDVRNAKIAANKKYHPDINKDPGGVELLKRINSAADVVLRYLFNNNSYAAC